MFGQKRVDGNVEATRQLWEDGTRKALLCPFCHRLHAGTELASSPMCDNTNPTPSSLIHRSPLHELPAPAEIDEQALIFIRQENVPRTQSNRSIAHQNTSGHGRSSPSKQLNPPWEGCACYISSNIADTHPVLFWPGECCAHSWFIGPSTGIAPNNTCAMILVDSLSERCFALMSSSSGRSRIVTGSLRDRTRSAHWMSYRTVLSLSDAEWRLETFPIRIASNTTPSQHYW